MIPGGIACKALVQMGGSEGETHACLDYAFEHCCMAIELGSFQGVGTSRRLHSGTAR
jgi:hypothetical protein